MAMKHKVAAAGAGMESAPSEVVGQTGMSRVPTREEISALAYSYWEYRGMPDGSPDEDWFRAETELRSRGQAGE